MEEKPSPSSSRSPRGVDCNDTSMSDESLMASALLRIRSEASFQSTLPAATDDSKKETASKERSTAATVAKKTAAPVQLQPSPPSPPNQTVPNPLVSNIPLVPNPAYNVASTAGIQSFPSLGAHAGIFTPEQVTALRAAAAAGAASFAAAAANPLNHINMMGAAAAAAVTSRVAADLIAPGPASSHFLNGGNTNLSAHADVSSTASVFSSATTANNNSEGRPRSDSMIRRAQVEAALRSKPQRGRKREDLSELERLELTRTRNREHAKSTRIRKKARYQELLEIEKKFEDMEKENNLMDARRESVLSFIRARERMLRSLRPSDESHSSGEHTAPTDNVKGRLTLDELVEDKDLFLFVEPFEKSSGQLSGVERMKLFDEYVHSNVVRRFGNTVVPLLTYGIIGDERAIALDSINGGMVEIELFVMGSEKHVLFSGLMKFHFSPNSYKLRSVSHGNVSDSMQGSDGLQAQVSYPSTVSLDPILTEMSGKSGSTNADKPEELAGPGMNI